MRRETGPGFIAAVLICFRKYAVFAGRAPRAEFWQWALFQSLVSLVFFALDMPYYSQCVVQFLGTLTLPSPDLADKMVDRLSNVTTLVMILPTLAVTVRRLHDIGKSGWWYFFGLIPLLGWTMALIWSCRHGTKGANRFGPDPLRGF